MRLSYVTHNLKALTERASRRQVNRVHTAQHRCVERACRVKQRVIEAEEVDTSQDCLGKPERHGA